MLKVLLLLAVLGVLTAAEEEIAWSFETYQNEPYSIYCNDTDLNVQAASEYVDWFTPGKKRMQSGYYNDHYEVKDKHGVPGFELYVKSVTEDTRGVYQCSVYRGSDATKRISTLRAINLYDHKYESLTDKYSYNIKVAFIATAVFLVPVATLLLVYTFRYQTDEEKEKKRQKKAGIYKTSGYPMEEYPDGVAEKARSPEGPAAYENNVDTEFQTHM